MVNKGLASKYGTPHDATAGDKVGAGTEAAARPAKSSSIENGKFTGPCSMYGVGGVGGDSVGSGGKRQHGNRGHSNISAPSP